MRGRLSGMKKYQEEHWEGRERNLEELGGDGCIAKEERRGLQIVSTAGISAQRWPGVIVPVGFGPHEN